MAKVTMHSLPANLTKEEMAELEAAEKMPIIFDDDCPEMTEEMLSQFHRTDMVTIQISPVNMKKVKSHALMYPFYRGYTTANLTLPSLSLLP